MIWYITWAVVATIVAAIQSFVACWYTHKYEALLKSYVEYRYTSRFRYPPFPDETGEKNNNGD